MILPGTKSISVISGKRKKNKISLNQIEQGKIYLDKGNYVL